MLSKKSSCEAADAAVSAAQTPSRRIHPFFNRTLFLKNCTRFWPIWLCYAVIWAFSLPVRLFVEMTQAHRYGRPSSDFVYLADRTILDLTSELGVGLALIFGLLAAVAVFSYLFAARSTGLMHTLPIRREGLFLTNYLSGLAFLFVPNLFIALLTFALESAAGILNAWNIVLWLLIQCGTCFFFYTFAILCGMFTGNLIAMPAFYGIFNCLAMVISALLDGVMNLFIFGYQSFVWGNTLAEWLTPCVKLINSLHFRSVVENGVDVRLFTGYQYVLAYCGVSVVFLICALYLYEARHMESAGDVIAVGWAKPVFKFGFAFCAALCGGFMLYYTFRSLFDEAKVVFILFCMLSGVIGCFVAEMLLQKSFKVFRKNTWLSCGIFSACLMVLMVGMTNDILGIESRVPDPDRVSTVQLSGSSLAPYDSAASSFYFSDPETIQAVVAMHQGIVDDRAFYKALDSGDSVQPRDGYAAPSWDYNWLNLDYVLSDGSTLSRSYHIPFNVSSETPDPDSVEGIYLALTNDVEHLLEAYFPDESLNARPSGGYLTVYNTVKNNDEDVILTAEQAGVLAQAAREDVLAGRLGIHYLNANGEARRANCAVRDLQLEWNYSSQNKALSSADGPKEGAATIAISSNSTSRVWSSSITPQFTATSLMTALHDLGILDDTHVLLSHTGRAGLEDSVKDRDSEVTYSYLN